MADPELISTKTILDGLVKEKAQKGIDEVENLTDEQLQAWIALDENYIERVDEILGE